MLDTNDILDTIRMISDENLDVRTVTMGISLLDCADADGRRACEKIYNKITSRAKNLVRTAERISATYGMPIVNKRVSVTPIAMLLASAPDADPVWYARALDAAAKTVGVNFIGGYSALVHKGFSAGDERLIRSIPNALAQTEFVCSSVNVGSTKSGINMDAVKMMGPIIKAAAEKTKDNMCMGAAKLVVFCNAPEDNPFMAGAFHGPGEPDCVVHVGVSGPGAVRAALAKLRAMVAAQGGDPAVIDDPSGFPAAAYEHDVVCMQDGWLYATDTEKIGIAAVLLGAGRETKESVIDPAAGIRLLKKAGDPVKKGDVLARLYAGDAAKFAVAEEKFHSALTFAARRPQLPALVLARVDKDGVTRF